MIMRPERETEEYLDPCLGQTDCRYVAEPLQESEPVPENAAPDQRAAAQTCCADDYASRPVARHARAIQCGWRQDHKAGVYTTYKCSWNSVSMLRTSREPAAVWVLRLSAITMATRPRCFERATAARTCSQNISAVRPGATRPSNQPSRQSSRPKP